MGFFRKLFGGGGSGGHDGAGGDGPGGGPDGIEPGDDDSEVVAWLREKFAAVVAPADISRLSEREVHAALLPAAEAYLAVHGDSLGMVFGLAVAADDEPTVRAVFPDLSREILLGWQDALEAAHGSTGLSFFMELAAGSSLVEGARTAAETRFPDIEFRGAARHKKRWQTFDASAVRDEELTPAFVDAPRNTNAADYVALEKQGEQIVGARIAVDYEADIDSDAVLAGLLAKPGAGHLRRLELGLWGVLGEDNVYGEALGLLSRATNLGTLERLVVGDYIRGDEMEISWTEIGDFGPVWKAVPALRHLRIQGGGIGLGTAVHERLEELVIESGGLDASAVRAIAAGSFPELRKLIVWFGSADYGANTSIEDFRPFFSSKGYDALTDLHLENAEISNELAEELATSQVPPRLEGLSFALGTLTDRGVEALVGAAGRFERLRRLDISENFVSPEGRAMLQAAFKNVEISDGHQDVAEDYGDHMHYFVSVAE